MEHLTECPLCGATESSNFTECKDFTVSGEIFTIVSCKNCGFLYTNPRPEKAGIGRYYESEDYISHSNSNKGLIHKLYKLIRSYSLGKKLSLVKSLPGLKKHSLLDIGCGTGEFLSTCKKAGWKTKGVEPNQKAREMAIQNHHLEVESEEWLLKTTDKFQVITLWHVLEHVHELKTRVKTIYDLLESGGYAVIAVPNYKSLDAQKYGPFWAAYDVPRHLYHFSPDTIKKLFKKNGLSHIRSMPMKFDSYYVSMLSERYRSGKNQYLKAFLNGYRSNQNAQSDPEKYSSVIYIFKKP